MSNNTKQPEGDMKRGRTRREFLQHAAMTAILPAIAPSHLSFVDPVGGPRLEGRCEFMDEFLGLQDRLPRLSWRPLIPVEGKSQVAYRITVASRADGKADLWNSGRIASNATSALYSGTPLRLHGEAHWKVQTWYGNGEKAESSVQRWSAGPLQEEDWQGSRWIGLDDILENTQEKMAGSVGSPPEPPFFPAPLLRKSFHLDRRPESALLYVAVGGLAETHVNGIKLGGAMERGPGFVNYQHRVEYMTFDVTQLLTAGENAVGLILGTGWFDVHDVATWHFDTSPWRQRPRARVMLVVKDARGTTLNILSDESWLGSTGPIVRDGIYTGEVYDARLEMPEWNIAGFDASRWHPALVVEAPAGKLVPVSCQPVRVKDTITPVRITEPTPGTFILDMGQSFSGHVQLRVKGPRGHAITMRYGEVLNAQGSLDTAKLDIYMMATTPRQPFQQDTYICKGAGEEEIWEQRFSYAGFQYVEVTNFPGKPTLDNFRGRFAHADFKPAGEFHCSNDVANAIQHATLWSYLSNAQSHPTDCPQREKNGWTGDAGLAVDCGLLNFQSEAFYRKWLHDLADAQRVDGGLPVIVPTGGWGDGRSWPGPICPPWDAAYPIIAWKLYEYTGDKRVLVEHLDSLRRYVTYFLSFRGSDGLVPGLGLGDWLPWKTLTPLDYVSNAYLFLCLDLLRKISEALGDGVQAAKYAATASDLALKIRQRFFHLETGLYANGSQTAQSLALSFGFVEEADRKAVFDALVKNVEALGHLDVGILGAKFLLRELSEGGRTDLALHIATQPALPGWGYWMKQGATTLWEDWEGVSSRNHIMFGDVSAWFYEWIAGIQQTPSSTGFQSIRLCPNPVGDLQSASAWYLTPRGMVRSAWKLEGGKFLLECTIPCDTSSELRLPADMQLKLVDGVQRSGTRCSLTPGVHTIEASLK